MAMIHHVVRDRLQSARLPAATAALALALAACGDDTGADGGDGGRGDTSAPSSSSTTATDASASVGTVGSGGDGPGSGGAPGAGGSGAGGNGTGGSAVIPELPSEVLDLTAWKLTLPVDTEHEGSPDEIEQPELAGFELSPWFEVTETGDGVRFRANCGGATTDNSGYPRSELREMTSDGLDEASWSTTEGVHRLVVTEAITALPTEKPHVVAAQIHDDSDDVVMVRLEGTRLFVEGGGDELGLLDDDYTLGTPFTVELVASEGVITVTYEGTTEVTVERDATGCYFKAGCYTQSNLEQGDEADAYGEVVILDLVLEHE